MTARYVVRAVVATVVVAGVLFTLNDFHVIVLDDALSLACGLMCGLTFAMLLWRSDRAIGALHEPYVAEGIRRHAPAVCSIGYGYLVLTQQRLVWLPKRERVRDIKKIDIPVTELAGARRIRGLVPNQFMVSVRTGQRVLFRSSAASDWVADLQPPRAIARKS